MATSPRSELRVLTITEFERSGGHGEWYWHTRAGNGEIVGDGGEGYVDRLDAVHGFLVQQGFDYAAAQADPSAVSFSKLIKISNGEYHIRRYAYGAPDPFDPDDPAALASVGWVPADVEGGT